jgi:DNA-binding MarR family transcriptional regulator
MTANSRTPRLGSHHAPSLDAELLVALRRSAAALDHALNDVLKPWELTATQYNVLRILRGAGAAGLCGREVGERMIARVPDVPRMLERMAEAGLVSRERDPADRRHTTARITAKGLRLLDEIAPTLGGLHRRAVRGLTREQMAALKQGLESIRQQV